MSDDSTFSYQEVRVLLTHFGSWLLAEHGLVLLSPALTVDRYLESVGASEPDDPEPQPDPDGVSIWQQEFDRIQERKP